MTTYPHNTPPEAVPRGTEGSWAGPGPALGAARAVLAAVFGDYRGPVALQLPDGEIVRGLRPAPCTVKFRRLYPLRELVLHQDLVRLGEACLAGDIEIHGDIERLFDLVDYLDGRALSWPRRLSLLGNALRLPKGSTEAARDLRAGAGAHRNSRRSIAHHYDVSNDFYRLWLDPEMVYSCAYFRDPAQPLAEAQRDKLDYLCRKLRLAPGQRLLDIGCGWGGLVSWAARHYGVEAHGITLSTQQYEYARERIRREGLDDGRVRVELRDYRDLPFTARYDRIVSVGMFEHIGVANYPAYFGTVRRALRPGGLFLNHGITSDSGRQSGPTGRFIESYVFPDGELATISDVCRAMERAGFELIDSEGLRPHYALTLRRWVAALESRREEEVALVGEPTYRLWRLYMAGSAHYFEQGDLGVYQVLAGIARQPLATPLRRNDLYVNSFATSRDP